MVTEPARVGALRVAVGIGPDEPALAHPALVAAPGQADLIGITGDAAPGPRKREADEARADGIFGLVHLGHGAVRQGGGRDGLVVRLPQGFVGAEKIAVSRLAVQRKAIQIIQRRDLAARQRADVHDVLSVAIAREPRLLAAVCEAARHAAFIDFAPAKHRRVDIAVAHDVGLHIRPVILIPEGDLTAGLLHGERQFPRPTRRAAALMERGARVIGGNAQIGPVEDHGEREFFCNGLVRAHDEHPRRADVAAGHEQRVSLVGVQIGDACLDLLLGARNGVFQPAAVVLPVHEPRDVVQLVFVLAQQRLRHPRGFGRAEHLAADAGVGDADHERAAALIGLDHRVGVRLRVLDTAADRARAEAAVVLGERIGADPLERAGIPRQAAVFRRVVVVFIGVFAHPVLHVPVVPLCHVPIVGTRRDTQRQRRAEQRKQHRFLHAVSPRIVHDPPYNRRPGRGGRWMIEFKSL